MASADSSSPILSLFPPTSSSTSTSSTTTTTDTLSTSSSSSTSSTPSTTSSSTTSSSTSSTPSLTSSSSSSPSTTSTSATSTSISTSSSVSSSPTSTFVVTSNSQTITITSVVNQSPSLTSSPAASSSASGSTSFFHNTGAVAGVFTVVGLVALAVIVWVISAAVRRRRAKQFDEDVAAAAAEAAASSRPPDFDDYDYSSTSGAGGGMYGFSDNSHVAFAQAHSNHEAYGMSEMSGTTYHNLGGGADSGVVHNYDPYPVANAAGAGAAGIGAGGIFLSKSPGPGADPYAAYSGPQDVSQQNPSYRSPGSQDWNDPGAYGGVGLPYQQQPQGQPLTRNRSQGANTVFSQSSQSQYSEGNTNQSHQALLPESYAAHYRQDFNPSGYQPEVRPVSAHSLEDAYTGVAVGAASGDRDELPNPFANATGDRPLSGETDESLDAPYHSSGLVHDEARMSIRDDEDYGIGNRVLKVANE